MTLQYRHNTRTLSEKIKFISTRSKQKEKVALLPVTKARANKLYICRQCTYSVYKIPSVRYNIKSTVADKVRCRYVANRGHRCHDPLVAGHPDSYAISVYNH